MNIQPIDKFLTDGKDPNRTVMVYCDDEWQKALWLASLEAFISQEYRALHDATHYTEMPPSPAEWERIQGAKAFVMAELSIDTDARIDLQGNVFYVVDWQQPIEGAIYEFTDEAYFLDLAASLGWEG